MPRNAQHSKATFRWGTPTEIVERARCVMGSIGFDPCSSVYFNETIKAQKYYSLDDRGENGLELQWYDDAIVNPPGGLVRDFWRKAMSEQINQMIWIGFSLEQLALLADEPIHPLDFTTCIPRKRIRFNRHDGYSGSPSHSNYITYMGGNTEKFRAYFADLGKVFLPR